MSMISPSSSTWWAAMQRPAEATSYSISPGRNWCTKCRPPCSNMMMSVGSGLQSVPVSRPRRAAAPRQAFARRAQRGDARRPIADVAVAVPGEDEDVVLLGDLRRLDPADLEFRLHA